MARKARGNIEGALARGPLDFDNARSENRRFQSSHVHTIEVDSDIT